MKIAVLGAGAMGSVFGGLLSLAGHEVTLIGRPASERTSDRERQTVGHIDAIRAGGLRLDRGEQEPLMAFPHATSDASELGEVDAIIVLTKTPAMVAAARSIRHAVGESTWVVPLMNGIGNERALGTIIDPARVVPGATIVGGVYMEPGRVLMTTTTVERNTITYMGPPAGVERVPDGVRELAATMTAAGLPTEAIDDANTVIWMKAATASCIAPITASLRRRIGEVWFNEHGHALIHDAFGEIVKVAEAEGIAVDEARWWAHLVATLDDIGAYYPSMARDIIAGRPTEIDSFNFEIARLADRHGIEAPIVRTLGRLVRIVEATPDAGRVA